MGVFVVCCQLEFSATVQGSPNECVFCQLDFPATDQGIPNECVCCLLSVRGLCDGLWKS